MTEAAKQKLSEIRKKLIKAGKISVWNKGLTKADPRVLKNISGGARKTQFKPGPRPETKGKNNANWKGGITRHGGKYKYIRRRMPEHPYAENGYVFEHRLVMEKHVGRYLKPNEVVHHINRDVTDNRLENLILFANQSKHMSHHMNKRK